MIGTLIECVLTILRRIYYQGVRLLLQKCTLLRQKDFICRCLEVSRFDVFEIGRGTLSLVLEVLSKCRCIVHYFCGWRLISEINFVVL